MTPEQKAAYMRERRARLRAERRCVDCGAGLEHLDASDSAVRCPECLDTGRKSAATYRSTEQGRKVGAAWQRQRYANNPEAMRQRRRDRYEAKKQSGECQWCSQPARDGSAFCATHEETALESHRRHNARRRQEAA